RIGGAPPIAKEEDAAPRPENVRHRPRDAHDLTQQLLRICNRLAHLKRLPYRPPGPLNRWIGVETCRDQTIGHLADRPAPAWQTRDPFRDGAHVWQSVGDCNGPADPLHTRQVIDVVADIRDLARAQVAFGCELLEGGQLVVAALNRLDIQFAAT